MDESLEHKIEVLQENGLLAELINNDDVTFEKLLEIIRRKRIELQEKIIKDFLADCTGDIAGQDTPEG